MECPGGNPIQDTTQRLQDRWVIWTTVWWILKNKSQKLPSCDSQPQRGHPLAHWGELQHGGTQLRSCEYPHTCPKPLPIGNFRVWESPAPVQEFSSKAAICATISYWYHFTSYGNWGSFQRGDIPFGLYLGEFINVLPCDFDLFDTHPCKPTHSDKNHYYAWPWYK